MGFAGGVGAFQKMAKTYGVKMPDEQAEAIKEGWRDAHPMTAGKRVTIRRGEETFEVRTGGLWKDLNEAAKSAVRCPGDKFAAGHPGRGVVYLVVGSFLWGLLPSGRAICYPSPKLLEGRYGPQLTYMSVPGPDDVRISDPQNSGRWARIATHGGPLTQNIVSGICRDLLAEAMLQLHDEGYEIALHVHDDVNLECLEAISEAVRDRLQVIMNSPPAWAKDFPLTAKPEIGRRYG